MKPAIMCVDCETTGLDWTTDKLHGFAVSYEEGTAKYYPAWDVPEDIRRNLADPEVPKLNHNLHGFDAKFLQHNGFTINGEFHDTMVIWNLCGEESLSLEYLTKKHIGEDTDEWKSEMSKYCHQNGARHVGELCAKDLLDSSRPHTEFIGQYCEQDVLHTMSLYFKGIQKLKELDLFFKNLGFKKTPLDYYFEEAYPLERVLFEIEIRGIRINTDEVNRVKAECEKKVQQLEKRLSQAFVNRISRVEDDLVVAEREKVTSESAKAKRVKGEGKCKFSWRNNNHVASLLYLYCDLPAEMISRTKAGKFQTNKAAVQHVIDSLPESHRLRELLALYAEYKKEQKILQTYTGNAKKGLLAKARVVNGVTKIFPTYRQTTGTGRLAASNPNMQNLPRNADVKRFFIPDNDGDVFDDFDYSQIELRTAAHLSNDPKLIDAYNNGKDVHILTASRLFGREITKADDIERQAGKRTNFLTIFDGKEFRLRAMLKQDTGKDFSLEECKEFIRIWFEEYQGVRAYLDSELQFFRRYKCCISETGRVRKLPDIRYENYTQLTGFKRTRFCGPPTVRDELVQYVRDKYKKPADEFLICTAAKGRFNHAVKMGYNQPIQGLAASMTKRAMIAAHRAGVVIANQVHDNLTVSRPKNATHITETVKDIMQTVYPLRVPVLVDVKTLKSFHPKDVA